MTALNMRSAEDCLVGVSNRYLTILDKSQGNFNPCPAEPGYNAFGNRVDPDQLASEEAN